jgi:hypothetical protein
MVDGFIDVILDFENRRQDTKKERASLEDDYSFKIYWKELITEAHVLKLNLRPHSIMV